MRSAQRGKRTSVVEVTNVSPHGLRLLLGERELFLPFDKFPWFREAPIAKLVRVELPSGAVLFREGDRSDHSFVIHKGTVAISRAGTELARRGPAEWIGELSMIDPESPRSATATAVTPVSLLQVQR